MPDIEIDDFPDDLYAQLSDQARAAGLSPEELVLRILRRSVEQGNR